MLVDAAAMVAVLGREAEMDRCIEAMAAVEKAFTSPIAVWEAAMALARPDKLDLPVSAGFGLVMQFLQDNGIELRQLPPPEELVALSASAAERFRGKTGYLNLADCFHYACAKHYAASVLSTADEFRFTDLDVVA